MTGQLRIHNTCPKVASEHYNSSKVTLPHPKGMGDYPWFYSLSQPTQNLNALWPSEYHCNTSSPQLTAVIPLRSWSHDNQTVHAGNGPLWAWVTTHGFSYTLSFLENVINHFSCWRHRIGVAPLSPLNSALHYLYTHSCWFHPTHSFIYHLHSIFLMYISSLTLSSGLQTSNLLHISLLGYLSHLKFNSSKNELLPPHHHHNSKPALSSFRKWQLNWSSQNLRIILNASIFNVLHTHTISKSYNLWFQNISSIWPIPVSFQILFWPKPPPSRT